MSCSSILNIHVPCTFVGWDRWRYHLWEPRRSGRCNIWLDFPQGMTFSWVSCSGLLCLSFCICLLFGLFVCRHLKERKSTPERLQLLANYSSLYRTLHVGKSVKLNFYWNKFCLWLMSCSSPGRQWLLCDCWRLSNQRRIDLRRTPETEAGNNAVLDEPSPEPSPSSSVVNYM